MCVGEGRIIQEKNVMNLIRLVYKIQVRVGMFFRGGSQITF